MILPIDNYNSFTYNLAQYLGTFSDVQALRNDDAVLETAAQTADALALSPGPGWPTDAGKLGEMIRLLTGKKPILGICLGHRAIAETFGGKPGLVKNVMRGKQNDIELLAESPVFSNLVDELPIMRYHSIVVTEMPEEFEVVAKITDDQEIMAIQHENLPICGLQFYPGNIGPLDGLQMIENFVRSAVEKQSEEKQ